MPARPRRAALRAGRTSRRAPGRDPSDTHRTQRRRAEALVRDRTIAGAGRPSSGARSPTTTTSSSRGSRPSSRSRTAPPTRCTPLMPAAASSRRRPHGSARSRSSRSFIATVSRARATAGQPADAARRRSTIERVSFPPRGERSLLRLAIGLVVLAIGVGIALTLLTGGKDNSFDPDVGFVATDEDAPRAAAPRARSSGHPADDGFVWPVYGFSKARTHNLRLAHSPPSPLPPGVGAPRARAARVLARAVRATAVPAEEQRRAVRDLAGHRSRELEAPAGRAGRRIAGLRPRNDLRRPAAARPRDGRGPRRGALRKARPHALVAPAAEPCRVLAADRSRPALHRHGGRHGLFTAREQRRDPLAHEGRRRGQGRDRACRRQALLRGLRRQGARDQTVDRQEGLGATPGAGPLGLGAGNFYSSAAVAYGRVYIGSTNGSVYSLSSADGKLAWSRRTGGYVYASPAVGEARRVPPTVYIGSYDGRFYALDARTGEPRWVRSLGTKISGAASIIGDLVFVSDLGRRRHGHSARAPAGPCGRRARRIQPGDQRRPAVYFTAYTSLFALDREGNRWRPAQYAPATRERRGPPAAGGRHARRRHASGPPGASGPARSPAASASCATASRRTGTATAASSATSAAAIATGTSTGCAAGRSSCATATATRTSARGEPGSRPSYARTAMPAAAGAPSPR